MCGADSDSALYELYRHKADSFASEFHTVVLPAIGDGFDTERYSPEDIARFSLGIDRLLERLDPALPQTFRNFAIPLVAGLIYGPAHPIAQAGSNSATLRPEGSAPATEIVGYTIDMQTVVLTQIFDDSLGLIGHTGSFDRDALVLFGRSPSIEAYLAKCRAILGDAIAALEPAIFPIASTHKSISKAHGALARIGDTWYFCDFSANGSYIENGERMTAVYQRAVSLAPGDRIYLGLSEPAENAEASYRLGTALVVAFKVDEAQLS